MYCSTCGVAVVKGLSYCNYCGSKLGGAGDHGPESPEVRPELLISAMAGVFILGMAIITLMMIVMKNALDLPSDRVLAFALVPFLLMLLLQGVFLGLLFRRRRNFEDAPQTKRSKEQVTNELDAARAGELPEHMPSVTEHTTRAFDPIYTERKSK